MKAAIVSFGLSIFMVSVALAASAVVGYHYDGQIQSASKDVAVKFKDGKVLTFDVSHMVTGSISNEPYSKVASLAGARSGSSCSKMIGELASDYDFMFKTDENELVKLSIKASTAERPIRISGDCDGKISGAFSLYYADDQPPNIEVTMSQEPAGPPRPNARYFGTVVDISPNVSVRGEDGTVKEFSAKGLKVGAIYNGTKSVVLSIDGSVTKCGDSLGELTTDFTVTVQTKKGMVRKATVRAAPEGTPATDSVRVFGVCNGGALTQLQLDTSNAALFEIQ